MKPSTFLLFLTWFFSSVELGFSENVFDDWQDPHDIFGKTKSVCGGEYDACREDLQHCRDELYEMREENRCKGPRVVKQSSVADHYLKRFINVLLSSADFKHRKLSEGSEMRVNLNLYFNSKTLPILHAFASEDTNGFAWSELDASFVKLFDGDPEFRASHASRQDQPLPEFTDNRSEDFHLTILIAVVSSVGFSVMWVFLTGKSFKSAFFVGSVLIVSFCFGWTWWSEVENQKMKFMLELSRTDGDQIPDSCKNPSSGWFGWVSFIKSSREEDCLKYLKARNVHPFAAVDLAHIISKTLQTLVFSWIPALARSCSVAIDEFYGTSWFGSFGGTVARIVTAPMVTITVVLLLGVYMITKSSFRFKTPLCEVNYGSQTTSPSIQPAQNATQYGRTGQDQELLTAGSSEPSEPKKGKKVYTKLHRPKTTRSESAHLLYADRLPFSLQGPKLKVSRLKWPFKSKQQEEKRFRELRRAYSNIE